MTEQPPLVLARTFDEATSAAWLTRALADVIGGATVTQVEVVEKLRTMATKIRFAATWDKDGTTCEDTFCLKAFLDLGDMAARAGPTSIIESRFYRDIAPHLSVTVPDAVAPLVNLTQGQGVLIMRDLIPQGGRFCTPLDPLNADDAAQSLDQLARLHAGGRLPDTLPWLGHRVSEFANASILDEATLQGLMDGPRGQGLDGGILSAARLLAGLKALADYDQQQPATLIHGDCHGGNLYQINDGFGLIDWQLLQRGGWALDIAYHIAAVLPVDVAEREERRLLTDYLARARHHGSDVPDADLAWAQYRRAAVWGYYLWSITRNVDPAIINVFVNRLGNAVARHDSFGLLGV